jgi:prophage tail gpP-like protein
MTDEVALEVGGKAYRGWQRVNVTRGIETVSGSFSLGVSERWETQGEPWPIGEGERCTVRIAGVPVITGFVDERSPSFSATSHSVDVSGRDAAGDLVDSSLELDRWEFSDVDVLTLARKICAPFGLDVKLQTGLTLAAVTIPKRFSIDPGDTAFSALEHLCRTAGVLPVSDGLGGITLTRGSSTRAATEIVEGINVLEASARFAVAGRFRTYKVLGSHRGSDNLNGSAAARVRGSAIDLGVARAARTLIVRPEGNVTTAQAKTRAEWEATTRAAKAVSVSVTVQGWRQSDGKPWPVNAVARVKLPTLGLASVDMLIAQATYSASVDSGTTTRLELRRPDAYRPDPTIRGGTGGNNYWPEIVKGV